MTPRTFFALAVTLVLLLSPRSGIVSAQSPSVIHDWLFTKILINPDVVAVQDGAWSDPATWGGTVPGHRARVSIPSGLTVTVDTEIATAYDWIRNDGTLRFQPDVDTRLIVETVGAMGRLEMGTASQPIQADKTARIVFRSLGVPIEHATGTETASYSDPLELSRGLIAATPVSIYGAAKTEIVELAMLPGVGATTLQLAADLTGWRVGDELLVNPTLWGQDEVVTVVAIEGRTVTTSPPLKYTRQNAPADPLVKVHVGNLTRNVILQTDTAHAGDRKLQGHVMLMGGAHRVFQAAFLDTGRTVVRGFYAIPGQSAQWRMMAVTDPIIMSDGSRNPQLMPICGVHQENPRGRYSLHFHKAEPGSEPSIAEGNVVRVKRFMGFKIGIQNHSSHVLARRNIVHNIDGSAMFTEFGDERGEYVGNMGTHGLGGNSGSQSPDVGSDACQMNNYLAIWNMRPQSFGWKGACVWLQGGNVAFNDNICAGYDQAGIDHEAEGLGRRKTGVPPIFIRPDHLALGFEWYAQYMLAKFKKVIDPTVPVLVEREPVARFVGNHIYAIGAAPTEYVKNPRYGAAACIAVGTGLQLTDYAGFRPKNLIKGGVCWNVGGHAITSAYSSYNNVEDFVSLPGVVLHNSRFAAAPCRGGINPNTQGGQAWTFANVRLDAGAVPNCGFAQLGPISVLHGTNTVNGKPYVPTIEVCEDGVDNDGDTLIDEGCLPPAPAIAPPPDTTPPVATVEASAVITGSTHTISVAADEPATATVTLDEETEPRCSGPAPLTCPITLTAWPRTATITLTDAAGNTAAPVTQTLVKP